MIFGEFRSDETRHGWFAAERKQPPSGFTKRTQCTRRAQRNFSGNRRFTEGNEQLINPSPKINRFAVRDKISPSADRWRRHRWMLAWFCAHSFATASVTYWVTLIFFGFI